jgi:hypothetical protein
VEKEWVLADLAAQSAQFRHLEDIADTEMEVEANVLPQQQVAILLSRWIRRTALCRMRAL